ncbi:hypothetical protein KR054_005737 [Drosophila jambulina]|nr:hypothetical protein KR054_005737 [Drosophila jambulina]
MSAIRILFISLLLVVLLVTSIAEVKYCVPFTGCNGCIKGNYTEPDLPPIDNECCGPHCRYTALNGEAEGPCNVNTTRGRCLLDTHCTSNITFIYRVMNDCEFQANNTERAANGFAREYLKYLMDLFAVFIRIFICSGYLAFNWTEATCLAQNTKCGINCCCRETCPTKFCVIQNSTTCP